MKDLIGESITYRNEDGDTECTILEVKDGLMLLDLNSAIGHPRFKSTYLAKLQPNNGGKSFWTAEIRVRANT